MLFFSAARDKKLGMQAQFFDVAQNEERILNLPLFDYLLIRLILDQKLVNQLLRLAQRQPYNEICL